MKSEQARHRAPASARTATTASLSVVVVASPGVAAIDVARCLSVATRELGAQLILVGQGNEPAPRATDSAVYVRAPEGSSRAEMCDMGMRRASGAIVAVRDAADVGDGRWLDAYRSVLPAARKGAAAPVELLVMDSMDARRAVPAADGPAPYAAPAASPAADARALTAAIEMAAAV